MTREEIELKYKNLEILRTHKVKLDDRKIDIELLYVNAHLFKCSELIANMELNNNDNEYSKLTIIVGSLLSLARLNPLQDKALIDITLEAWDNLNFKESEPNSYIMYSSLGFKGKTFKNNFEVVC